ncbi:MAG: DUF1549 and DUF1553 domain-containing protein [Pirellulaceae bacterium]|jgi:hypothetical protein|nr:DUF1549 and DUF1553 domain-containing protein [Pirellulaceae bacterium]MDP7020515.1 DUF1549 and DUF1553 domain-containing protein [Pirellulaceae bacterium]
MITGIEVVNTHLTIASLTGFTWLLLAGAATAEVPPGWPFAAVEKHPPPTVSDSTWPRNEIDAFVLRRLVERELRPAAPASKRVLVRRLYLDLLGLPPTPAETTAFVDDASLDAQSKLVNRLLDDRRYGERSARWWLDLARYADTAGYEGDPDLPHAWRYRDYVIDAFNSDKPYDLFIKEQIAGDEFAEILGAGDLPGVDAEKTVALTFLRLAPFTEPRGDESRHELLSEMTSTVSSVFLGLTVGCAKCHDHKYDAIPTRDFYRLQAFFATVQIQRPLPGDGFQIGGPLPASFYRPGEADAVAKRLRELDAEEKRNGVELAELRERVEKRLGSHAGFGIQAMGGPLGNDYVFERRAVSDGKPRRSVISSNGEQWDYYTDGARAEATGSLAGSNRGHWYGDIPSPRYVGLGQYTAGKGEPSDAPFFGSVAAILIFDHPLSAEERTKVDRYLAASPADREPLGVEGLRCWFDANDIDADPTTPNPAAGSPLKRWIDKVGRLTLSQTAAELQPKIQDRGNSNVVVFDNSFLIGDAAQAAFIKDQTGSIVTAYTSTNKREAYLLEVGGEGAFVSTFVNPTAASKFDWNDERITADERQRYERLTSRQRHLPQHRKRLQPLAMSLRHSYGPPYEPGVPVSRVKIRGEYDNPGEVVVPGFLTAITGSDQPAAIRLDPFKRWPTRSRRMALAKWIAAADNPLTARVIVNRLWAQHFGRGIVRTPSDFGALSSGPSHPQLIDWLALKLVENKWSLKSVHRLICNSAAYSQEAGVVDKNASQLDPNNTLLWRYPMRRLEGEAIRDSILAVSGRLNPQSYGLPIFPPLPDDIADRVKYSNSKWDTQHGDEGRRRSIYIYQQRTLNMPMLQTFDATVCDESKPRRSTSITPLQALALYNGPLVTAEAPHFARRVIEESGEDSAAQIALAFEYALGRPPGDDELSRLTDFYDAQESASAAMQSICRILFNTNEFLYIP